MNHILETSAKLVRDKNLTQQIHYLRTKDTEKGPVANTRLAIVVPAALTLFRDMLFMFADSGQDDPMRILIFATMSNLDLLNQVQNWYADGTFSVSPAVFFQLYTVNIIFHGKNLPMLYACLPNKEKITYTKLWTLLKPVIKTTPKSITHDFEQAAIGGVKATWKEEFKRKELVISGCYFHYDQCLWRQIQAKELSIQYKNDLVCRITFRALECLAFIPLNDVFYAFDIISNESPAYFEPFLEYFEFTWIGKKDPTDKQPNRRKKGLFPIEMWSVHDRVLKGLPRTNNSTESWHKLFEAMVKKHPCIYKLIEGFHKEQANTEKLISQIRSGDEYRQKESSVQKDKKLHELVLSYNKENLKTFIKDCTHVLLSESN